jgi:hypothetical protein
MTQAGYDAAAALAKTDIDGQRRPEELPPERIYSLFAACG